MLSWDDNTESPNPLRIRPYALNDEPYDEWLWRTRRSMRRWRMLVGWIIWLAWLTACMLIISGAWTPF